MGNVTDVVFSSFSVYVQVPEDVEPREVQMTTVTEGKGVEGLTPTLCHDVALAFASVPRTTADDSLHAFLGPSNTSTVACFARALVLGSHRSINQPVWKLGGVVYFGEGVSLLASGAGGEGLV